MREHRTREHWYKIFQEQEASNLNVTDFCKEKGIVLNTFYNTRQRLNYKREETSQFVEIKVPHAIKKIQKKEVVIEVGKIKIKADSCVDESFLTTILKSALDAANA